MQDKDTGCQLKLTGDGQVSLGGDRVSDILVRNDRGGWAVGHIVTRNDGGVSGDRLRLVGVTGLVVVVPGRRRGLVVMLLVGVILVGVILVAVGGGECRKGRDRRDSLDESHLDGVVMAQEPRECLSEGGRS